jgi:hypothetical protein
MALDPLFEHVSVLCPLTEDEYSLVNRDTGEYGYSVSFSSGEGVFGDAAGYVDGLNDYWYTTNTAVLPTGADDFTIEGWTKLNNYDNVVNTVANLYQSSSQGLRLSLLDTGAFRLEFRDEFYAANHTETVAQDEWFHWAITRASSVFNLWVNGVGLASPHTSSVILNPSRLYLGAPGWDHYEDELDGYYNELRVTLNHARYSADFTPPTEPFPRYGAIIEGRVLDDSGAPAQRTLRLYNRETGALVSSVTSDSVTGLYQMPNTLSGVEGQLVCLDDAAGTAYNDKITRISA